MEINKSSADRFKNGLPYLLGVICTFLISLYIRLGSKDSVILSNGFVRFGENDPWYHMRLVEIILHNYPHVPWYEPFTMFPTGQGVVFAPLFDWVLATIIYIVTLGNPTMHQIEVIGAYYPAFIGALVVVPVYYVGKLAFGRNTGLLAAFLIAIMPGTFLHRSLVGFTDHHVAETLLSTTVALFLILSLKSMRANPVSFDDLAKKQFYKLKPSIKYIVLTGISMGLYILTWKGAIFFALIICVYFAIQHILDHLRNQNTEYLAIIGSIIFLIPLLMVLPLPDLGQAKTHYLFGLPAGIMGFLALSALSRVMNKRKIKKYYYIVVPFTIFIALMLLTKIFVPHMYDAVIGMFTYFMRTGGGLTIGEAAPFFVSRQTGLFSLAPLYANFGIEGFIVFLAIPVLLYQTWREHKQEEVWILVWTLMMVWALYQQNRFAYYFVVNIALLSAYLTVRLLSMAGWGKLASKYRNSKEKGLDFAFKNVKIIHVTTLAFAFIVLVYPIGPLSDTLMQNQGVGGPEPMWIDSLTWMRYNTPETGMDFYERHEYIPDGGKFEYPKTAYGVMSWWDYGHWITYIAQRIPNANPFQSGIGGGDVPGAASYLTSQTEEEANSILEQLGSKYVITNGRMAYTIFGAIAAWDGDTEGYYTQVSSNQGMIGVATMKNYNTIVMRLHFLDGDNLKHYRMVHESQAYDPDYEPYVRLEHHYKNVYNMWTKKDIPIATSGFVKTFEYLKGATITGTAPAGETVTISNTILTNQMRTFSYSQTVTSDGTYSFTVPYSTQGPIPGETQFAVKPTGPYTVQYGTTTLQVQVPERAVLDGSTISV